MTENILVNFSGTLNFLKQEAKNRKVSASDGEEARHWAVVYTELEKVYAYVQSYLVNEENSDGV